MKVNDEMLRFYWTLGRGISLMNKEAKYMENGTAHGILTGPKVKDRTYMKLSTGYLQAPQ